jgi:putative component of toxin-antitoxin plasmid stabilization module
MIEIREYIDRKGGSLHAKWFNRLNAPAAAKIVTALVRMEHGNLSSAKGVGAGVFECRAKVIWKEYKQPKRQEG